MSPQFPPVSISNTQGRTIRSSFVDQEYNIFVALPESYGTSNKLYPVLYLTDANLFFGAGTDYVRALSLSPLELPELIVVGIAYPVGSGIETLSLRWRDMTPTDTGVEAYNSGMKSGVPSSPDYVGAGGAEAFLQLIQEELIPLINSEYQTDSDDRAYMGDSLGGLFGLYALFHKPETFKRYIIGSPSIWWDQNVTFSFESDYAAKNDDLPARVFMGVGELEESPENAGPAMVTNVKKMKDLLTGRDYPGLELTTHIFEGETHLSVVAMNLVRGLKTVFADSVPGAT
jgi:predicted alpha/beta superfamily hydrolase